MGNIFNELLHGTAVKSDQEVGMKISMMDVKEHKNPLVIYHGNCADGFSAAWVFHHIQEQIEQNFDFHPGVYNDPPPDCSGRIVYLVDFSYSREVVEKICAVADEVWLIDHHKTAIDALVSSEAAGITIPMPTNFHHYVDMERSGAMLAWDFWHNAQFIDARLSSEFEKENPLYVAPPKLLDHIQDRDLWKFKLPFSREINAAVFSYEYTFENWDKMMLGGMKEIAELTQGGAAIERKHHKDVAEMVKVCKRWLCIGGTEVPTASLPYIFAADAGHLMAKEFEGGTKFAACYYDTAEHRVFSLRSTENGMDVSEIAKSYGGGGHKHAAGFRVPRIHVLAMQ